MCKTIRILLLVLVVLSSSSMVSAQEAPWSFYNQCCFFMFEHAAPSGNPPADSLYIYAKDVAGVTTFAIKRSDGVEISPSNVLEAEVDFGAYPGSGIATKTVTGQAWVTASSKIVCTQTMMATADRAEGAEDPIIERMTLAVHTRSVGAGFKITMAPALGNAIGKYLVQCSGS